MAQVLTITASYIAGGSFKPNLSEQVDVSPEQDGSQMETRYYCMLSASFDSYTDTGELRPEPNAQKVRLIDPDTVLDYKTVMWDVPAFIKALPDAAARCSAAGKIANAGYDPAYPTYSVTSS